MPRLVRTLQMLGLAIVALSAFWTQYELRAHPAWDTVLRTSSRQEAPAQVLGEALQADLEAGPPGRHLWEARRWYPFALVPLWALALVWVVLRPVARARVGVALMLLAVGLAVLEAFYLALEYAPLFPDALGHAEAVLVWLLVSAVLLLRRAPDRNFAAVEAHVAAQALLGWMHLLTLPATQARCWLDRHSVDAVACAVASNFAVPFWWGIAGLALMSLPVYLRRVPRSAPSPAGPTVGAPP
jgi:hypothetical protein